MSVVGQAYQGAQEGIISKRLQQWVSRIVLKLLAGWLSLYLRYGEGGVSLPKVHRPTKYLDEPRHLLDLGNLYKYKHLQSAPLELDTYDYQGR